MARKKKRKAEAEEGGFADTFEGFGGDAAEAGGRPRLTPVEVQQKVFRLAFRGYNERDVDQFLDQVTEELAALHEENKRLREQLQEGGASPQAGAAGQRQAEAIVRQAREEAGRVIEEAERRAGQVGTGSTGQPPPGSFLVRERDFLQRLASLVQGHARTLKEEAQRARAAREGAISAETPAETGEQPPSAPAAPPASESPVPTEVPSAAPEGLPPEPGPAGPVAGQGADTTTEPEETERRWPEERPEGQDPLLSAWESAFAAESEDDPSRAEDPARARRRGGEEPSLRELFWGEE